MSPRADHADTIIAVADVRCRRSSEDHHIAAGRDGQAGQQPGAPGETDAYPEPGTTTGHNGDPPVSIPRRLIAVFGVPQFPEGTLG